MILYGKQVAEKLSDEIIEEVRSLKDKGIEPKLAIVRVGRNEGDLSYERGALKRAEKLGIKVEVFELEEGVKTEDLIECIDKINNDVSIHGILLFRPLSKNIDENKIKNYINPNKDVDCINPINVAKVMEGDKTGFAPCTPSAVIEILKHYGIELKGKNVVIIGRSMVVGKPLSMLLLNEDATVTICHSKTQNLKEITKKADILIVAIGHAKYINKEYVGENTVVVDVGINVDNVGNLCGDVDFEDVKDIVSDITPVPGGVGAVTNTVLFKNLINACRLQIK
ncbi:MAG: bifunctional 5,10-methylene-tetrahydrofolate dehydrogenase/5,10-methylene-tetrahydrofolate [Caloramator sp.]|uniref:bifunctional 5,10-methylenetetrahydrofolate dehydrogenase/5,10-methenyltetrahydrofolate cyclohydrolase n=1 Tax=Caloramator sp. TaxID=1871330 RepID=UPI001DB83D77|nr:tetrahydrofolate dehydrogenase/cyclohydrolase catalytic domain-containing protein [Caloramator sp.]MBZ4663889.1 bifunctional 5,10-methylene-tetrahydrofolate dehydrogenase/5,10-methylene-tetrahydrofolate [Caloramator sp.]